MNEAIEIIKKELLKPKYNILLIISSKNYFKICVIDWMSI